MQLLNGEDVARALPWPALIDVLHGAFAGQDTKGITAPVRHQHGIALDDNDAATLLLMPAWRSEEAIGVKLVSVFPRNSARGLPGVDGVYVLIDGKTGTPVAVLDGGALTVRRTAAASALAARHLARPDARTHLMVGTGRLARNVPPAMGAVLPIERILVWGRRPEAAEQAAADLRQMGLDAQPVATIEEGARQADVISCATNATAPLLTGEMLRPGQHIDLIGAFTPTMMEAAPEVFAGADLVVADTYEGVFEEAGDLLAAIDAGAITRSDVATDLAALCRGDHAGRGTPDQITVFKSCGTALEDLSAALHALKAASA